MLLLLLLLVPAAGLVPEQQLERLVANRVDYHFARICSHTDDMAAVFKEVRWGGRSQLTRHCQGRAG